MKALGFNWLKAHPFQDIGFKCLPANPYTAGRENPDKALISLGQGDPTAYGKESRPGAVWDDKHVLPKRLRHARWHDSTRIYAYHLLDGVQ